MMGRLHIALFLLALVAALISSTEARKKLRRIGSGRHQPHGRRTTPTPDEYENEFNEISENEVESSDDLNQGIIDAPQQYDPCRKRHCSAGQECKLTEDGEPICICITDCPIEADPRRKVCSNLNETWESDCGLSQMRCWCESGDARCQSEKMSHHHIDYFGSCKVIEECSKEQMVDFPRRMRDWLFHVMQDLADREELSPYYLRMERNAESNHTRRWTAAAVWKFCDLDSGHDRSVSRHELFPIRAPLVAMEHCIAPFLNRCDSNDDHKITLEEWTHCLELDQEDIEEQCEEIRQNEE